MNNFYIIMFLMILLIISYGIINPYCEPCINDKK